MSTQLCQRCEFHPVSPRIAGYCSWDCHDADDEDETKGTKGARGSRRPSSLAWPTAHLELPETQVWSFVPSTKQGMGMQPHPRRGDDGA